MNNGTKQEGFRFAPICADVHMETLRITASKFKSHGFPFLHATAAIKKTILEIDMSFWSKMGGTSCVVIQLHLYHSGPITLPIKSLITQRLIWVPIHSYKHHFLLEY